MTWLPNLKFHANQPNEKKKNKTKTNTLSKLDM